MAIAGAVTGATLAGSASAYDCPPPVEPVLSLSYQSRYLAEDASRSVIDDEAEADAVDSLAPVDDFLRALARQSDAMLAATGMVRAEQATCILRQIDVWAKADALSDLGSEAAQLGIGSRLASFGLLLRLAMAEIPRQPEQQGIERWLSARLSEQMTYWETAPQGAARGNLRAWAALAAAAGAAVTRDPVQRGWAAWSTRYVLCTANADGSIPQEMTRGHLALHYQLHALAPLVTSVALLRQQRIDLTDHCDGALARAVTFALEDLATGARSAAISGETQSLMEPGNTLKAWQIAWLEAYLTLAPDPKAEALAASFRPMRYSKLGGDQTLIWRRR